MKRFSRAAAGTANDTATPKKKARKPPAKFKGTDHWITKEQFSHVCAEEPNEMYVAIFKVMASHGMRVSEVLALRRDDVANGFIVARRLKGSQVTMQKLLVNLDAFIAAPTYRLFGFLALSKGRDQGRTAPVSASPAHA
jgi:integrase